MTKREREILDNEFELLLVAFLRYYLKFGDFESYQISFDSNQTIYNITITKRTVQK